MFRCADGSHLDYEIAGDGPAVAFLHGFSLDRRMWDDQFESFAAHHRVLRHDFRGFGRSDPPTLGNPYTHAADLKELLRFNGIDRVALVGLSYGGWAALDFTLRHSELVSALVLVDSGLLDYGYSPEWRGFLDSLSPVAKSHGLAAAKRAWGDHPLFAWSNNNAGVRARIDAMVGDYSGWHWVHDDPRTIDRPVHERLAEIDVPALVIVGEHDIPDFHTIAQMLSTGIRGARSVVLPGAGHMANMDAPVEFNEIVLEFLRDVRH